jgi:hypothetical protein
MSRSLNIPYFASPPEQYSRPYFADLTRAFALFAQQMNTPGPWRATELTLTEELGNVNHGQLSWNIDEETVDITMGDGVVQQVGFETYMRVKNDTGATIPNGTVVGFAGVNSEIKVAPYIANSAANELYFVGRDNARHARPRHWPGNSVRQGARPRHHRPRRRDMECWRHLYVSPTTAGLMTNIRPTAPNVVIVCRRCSVSGRHEWRDHGATDYSYGYGLRQLRCECGPNPCGYQYSHADSTADYVVFQRSDPVRRLSHERVAVWVLPD